MNLIELRERLKNQNGTLKIGSNIIIKPLLDGGVFYFYTFQVKDIEIYVKILEKKYPQHHFELNVGGDSLYIYGKSDDTLYLFCENLSESMCKPIKRIAFIKS